MRFFQTFAVCALLVAAVCGSPHSSTSSDDERVGLIGALLNGMNGGRPENNHDSHTNWDNNFGDKDWYNFDGNAANQPFYGDDGVGVYEILNADKNRHSHSESGESHSSSAASSSQAQSSSGHRPEHRSSSRRSSNHRSSSRGSMANEQHHHHYYGHGNNKKPSGGLATLFNLFQGWKRNIDDALIEIEEEMVRMARK